MKLQSVKISVIVPVYNVKAYLHQCLDSITNQTHRNLEIILVDDGSPDTCGSICDAYAANDDRILVIHQENAGQSAARNKALDLASGDYIGFVDSDDWIEPEMFETMLQKLQLYQADICTCGVIEECPNRRDEQAVQQLVVLDREESLRRVVEEVGITRAVWDKLWKRELFEGIRFPVGMKYEDLFIGYRLVERANRVVCIPDCFYHYRINPQGTMADIRLQVRLDMVKAAQQRLEDLSDKMPQLAKLLEYRCLDAAVIAWTAYYWNTKEDRRRYLPQLREIAAYAKSRWREAVRHTDMGAAGRLVLRLLPYPYWWSFALAGLIGWMYRQRHGRLL